MDICLQLQLHTAKTGTDENEMFYHTLLFNKWKAMEISVIHPQWLKSAQWTELVLPLLFIVNFYIHSFYNIKDDERCRTYIIIFNAIQSELLKKCN